ncbi:SMI1/KNR4 family protein [Streptomyces sp. NPDC059785]|uniref:SMI1/KNR4 family protein n=1 Tax=Streptomyces sp. NPDC059785 TaxID=3346945 RepID=UPI0036551242
MTADLVQESWSRIDAWLREHAPRTFATLRPPAKVEEITAAQDGLGITFPPDLIASLLRHDGALDGPEAFRFNTHDRLLGVSGILEDTRFMRAVADDLDEKEAEDYWQHGYAKFGSYGATSDGLMIDCRTGRDSFGAIGRFFDETGTSFGEGRLTWWVSGRAGRPARARPGCRCRHVQRPAVLGVGDACPSGVGQCRRSSWRTG